MANLLNEKKMGHTDLANPNFSAIGGGVVENCCSGPKNFGLVWVPQSPIGLISGKIGALFLIQGHASDYMTATHFKGII